MTPNVTAFGYQVPVVVVLVFVALMLGLALAVAFYLTIGWSVYRSVQSTRRERARERLEDEFLEHLFDAEKSWPVWIEGMSNIERDVVETLLQEYLWELDGSTGSRLQTLADVLGIPEREARQLRRGNRYERLNALTWLTLLDRPDIYRQSPFEAESSRERVAAARLLMTDEETGPQELVPLLLTGTHEPFSVFGLDTLYQTSREDPSVFFRMATQEYQQWPAQLQVQMLTVCKHLDIHVNEEGLPWLTAMLESDDEAVRAASARALGNFRWHQPLRDRVFLERAIEDPSPRVRGAVYEMLASWGDESAFDILLFALVSEDDPKAFVRGTNALVAHRERIGDRVAAVSGASWQWSLKHARYNQIARHEAPEVEL